MRLVYFICRWIGLLKGIVPGLILFKPKLYYEEPGKKPQKLKGGALVVSNHYAVFDYIVSILLFLPRFLRVVSAEFPYHNWFLTFGMNCFRGIKADRTVKSMRFVDESVSAIRSGDKVQIFPEGRNTDDGTIGPFAVPYLMIVSRSGKPIIPVVLDGNYGITKRVHMLIGNLIYPEDLHLPANPSAEELETANAFVRDRILRLKEMLDAKVLEDAERKHRNNKQKQANTD